MDATQNHPMSIQEWKVYIACLQGQVKTALEIRERHLNDDPEFAEQLLMIAAAAGSILEKYGVPMLPESEAT